METENIKKNQSEVMNSTTEMKNILEGISSVFDGDENHISDLEDKISESTQSEEQTENGIKKIKIV